MWLKSLMYVHVREDLNLVSTLRLSFILVILGDAHLRTGVSVGGEIPSMDGREENALSR